MTDNFHSSTPSLRWFSGGFGRKKKKRPIEISIEKIVRNLKIVVLVPTNALLAPSANKIKAQIAGKAMIIFSRNVNRVEFIKHLCQIVLVNSSIE